MKTEWNLIKSDGEAVSRLCSRLRCNPVTATILANRNILSDADTTRFLSPTLGDLRPPFDIRDMDRAVHRIVQAIRKRERILIFGDYDVDGITATTILLEFLQETGADVSYYIPHRTREGYDLQEDHIFRVALPREIDLIITVDCGSSRHDAVRAARESGIDVVITDHHTIVDPPPAVAVVNPKRIDCTAGFGHLAGVGVAFALLISLRKHLRDIHFWGGRPEPNLKRYCDLVALGTVADMVPLLRENRILSRTGLDVLNTGQRPGITALMQTAGIRGEMDAEDIAFRLAPRLNAAGRIDHAGTAVELLTTRDPRRAEEIARSLGMLNRKRQETEKEILDTILDYLDRHPDMLEKNSLVLAHPRWHEGVLGIVSAKLVDRFFRPVFLISTQNFLGKGSGRSIPGINLYQVLEACSAHLEKFGGHPMAAGLQIRQDRVDRFRDAFEEAVTRLYVKEEFTRMIDIDCALAFNQITNPLVDELNALDPFGEGNPKPLFMTEHVQVLSAHVIKGQHRRMTLQQSADPQGRTIEAMQFNAGPKQPAPTFDRIAYRLRRNRWNGRETIQIIIEET